MKNHFSLPNSYSLLNHSFLASPYMDALYVIREPELPSHLPSIVASVDFENPDQAISFQYLADENKLQLDPGNVFGEVPEVDMVRAGAVQVFTHDQQDANTLIRLRAYFNGAMIDNARLTLTVAGIGITDIISVDPVHLTLLTAPLTVMESAIGVNRTVRGLLVEYKDFTSMTFSGQQTSKIWGVTVILQPLVIG